MILTLWKSTDSPSETFTVESMEAIGYMRRNYKKILAVLLALVTVLLPVLPAKADTVDLKPYLSLGADLSEEQKKTVLSLLDVQESELSDYEVIEITNQDEHEYLDDYLSASVIGSKALSSVRIEKVGDESGIRVETKNISYCTSGMYTNALTTAGITDAEVVVAGPFEISGTAALVGAMKAYETMTGEKVDAESADAATNELVVTGDLGQELGVDTAEELVALAKQRVVDANASSTGEIREIIEDSAKELDVTLTEEQKEKLTKLFDKIKGLDLDVDKLKKQAEEVYNKLQNLGLDVEKASGILEKITQFFENLADKISSFFKNLF